jgi:attachment invasion locus protein
MSKITGLLISIYLISLGVTAAHAETKNNTISVGYAQSFPYWMGIEQLSGVNVKYRYEVDSLLGAMGSFSYTRQDYDLFNSGSAALTYSSFMMGPTFRANDYFSIYLQLGMARLNAEINRYYYNESASTTSPVYGGGFQINPIPNLALDVSYEYSILDTIEFGSWVFGIGYRF